ncbi:hypothetical protein SLE2022_185860 [Rubroshorea leprosula]
MFDECSFSSPKERVRDKLKSSICCFRSTDHGEVATIDLDELKPRTPRSPYTWLKSTAHELEIKDRCRNLIARIGKQGGRRQHGSSDFSYDPLSYALNFEDEANRADEMPVISFSSRLRASPERIIETKFKNETSVSATREIVLYS